jgi:hypothetical protein
MALNEMEVRGITDKLSIPDLLERYPRQRGSAKLKALFADETAVQGVTREELESDSQASSVAPICPDRDSTRMSPFAVVSTKPTVFGPSSASSSSSMGVRRTAPAGLSRAIESEIVFFNLTAGALFGSRGDNCVTMQPRWSPTWDGCCGRAAGLLPYSDGPRAIRCLSA